MESSSVYMCFPCYQEFNTLEEVLKHQLTCTAEDDGQTDTSGATSVTVPVLQTHVNIASNFPFYHKNANGFYTVRTVSYGLK